MPVLEPSILFDTVFSTPKLWMPLNVHSSIQISVLDFFFSFFLLIYFSGIVAFFSPPLMKMIITKLSLND